MNLGVPTMTGGKQPRSRFGGRESLASGAKRPPWRNRTVRTRWPRPSDPRIQMISPLVRSRLVAVGRVVLFAVIFSLLSGVMHWSLFASHLFIPRDEWTAGQFFVADGTGFIAIVVAAAIVARIAGRPV